MDSDRFERACRETVGIERERNGIGTLGEKTLHAVLKRYIEPDADNHEVRIGRYVADIVGEDGITEIQTGSFTPLRPKLETLLDYTAVTVVYPMAAVKLLSWIDPETGEVTAPRRSPKRMKPCDAFFELIKIKYTLDNPNFRLKLIMLELHEQRLPEPKHGGHSRGSKRVDRIPTRIIDEIDLNGPQDYTMFIPDQLPERFTITELAKANGVSYKCGQRALRVLEYLELVQQCGNNGRTKLFRRTEWSKYK